MNQRESRSGGRSSYRGPGRPHRDYNDEPRHGALADLIGHLHALDNRSYAAYRAIVGRYEAPEGWVLHIDRVQPDPYAPPTAAHVDAPVDPTLLPELKALLDEALLETADRRLAVSDFLVRELHAGFKGTALSIAAPGQEILERSAVVLRPSAAWSPDSPGTSNQPTNWTIELRLRISLPAQGRSIQGHEAARIIGRDLVRELGTALDLRGERLERLRAHVAALEDHRALTAALKAQQWVAFLADGSLLPRRSGVSDEPMRAGAVALKSPDSLAATVTLPHAGQVRGTAIGPGVTLIVGGGYHGKSTLLSAITRGVYPHVPGDGRELVATVPDAVKVRAADGRAVTGVDLSPFISHLPGGRDTRAFSTGNASGSTSQAASIVEAVEAGASALLLDEDTCATNLLIRDSRMRALVAAEREPITPLVDRIGALAREQGVSTLLVMGGSGDYLDVADRVLLMDAYHLLDVTDRAAQVAAEHPRETTALPDFPQAEARIPLPLAERSRRGPVRTRSRGTVALVIDREEVDVSDVSGVVDPGQAEALAHALRALLEQRFDGVSPLPECLADLEELLDEEGLDALDGRRPAFLVRPRMVDVAAAVNRYRSLALA
ncbi:Predicted ATPase of the ABC class [Actinomyces bovis]|uniref:Predicted ATPase of the ABC class n=1 Tax=Actinomyces bovis TaxID=1658 RepID=A0ABY1VNY0_9ACTO|nr:ABC-ATPase domain-containing protein [Actinomyces bovis]SPT53157.1 Predicted ATPase of the ABC class [Actinomyces bovis]VEG52337.1 Predicted ATPase of the ABC class [Actinomyces israelii]